MLASYVLLFFIYSFIGWIIEFTFFSLKTKKISDRGFLIGPFLPIYGTGGIIMTLLLQKYVDDPLVVILVGAIFCSTLEYTTSYLMEKLFKARWWDYSHMRFNLNGRISLLTSTLFGLGGYFTITFINPFMFSIFDSIPITVLNITAITLSIVLLVDAIISFKIIFNIRKINIKFSFQDNTEEITENVKRILTEKSALYRRLLKAFPSLKVQKPKPKKRNSSKS